MGYSNYMTEAQMREIALKAMQAEMASGAVTDESGDIPESAGEQDVMKVRQMQDQAAINASAGAQGSGELEKAGQLTTGAGAAAQNPAIAGVGLAMQGIGMVDSAKRNEEQAKITAYNNKIMAERSAIRNLFA